VSHRSQTKGFGDNAGWFLMAFAEHALRQRRLRSREWQKRKSKFFSEIWLGRKRGTKPLFLFLLPYETDVLLLFPFLCPATVLQVTAES